MPPLFKCVLSIIIPVYNLEPYIQRLIDSLKEQELRDEIEIIFVLNNCTDNSEQVIRNAGIGRILYCTEQGCGNARNMGMDAAQGEYVWFMDGDDWLLSKTAVQEAIDTAKGNDVTWIPFASDNFRYQYFSMVWQYILRREFVKDIQFPNYQPCEDDAYMDMVLAKAGKNRYNYTMLPKVNHPLYFYNYLRQGSNMYRVTVLGEKI